MTAERIRFDRLGADGAISSVERAVPDETPIAIEFNGLGYAVLMASDGDLIDLAYGFARSERLIDGHADMIDVAAHATERGVLLRATLAENVLPRVIDRVRHRVSESSCGLCGIENLDQALRPLPKVTGDSRPGHAAIFRALASLRDRQPLNAETGAVHAAALCTAEGAVALVREDVGRHNAFDKLLGAMLRDHRGWEGGFALLTSRCSYELVEKAVLADCPTLVTISAPTGLALRRAEEAGLTLIVLARSDAVLIARA